MSVPGVKYEILDQQFVNDARAALLYLNQAAMGSSNDTEISAGRDVADILASLVGYEEPDDIEELDDDEQVRF